MKSIFFLLLLGLLFGAPQVVNVGNNFPLRNQVVPIASEVWQCKSPQDAFSKEVRYLLQQNNKYLLNMWYNDVKHFIRPISHAAFTLAVCMKLKVYDEKVTGAPFIIVDRGCRLFPCFYPSHYLLL